MQNYISIPYVIMGKHTLFYVFMAKLKNWEKNYVCKKIQHEFMKNILIPFNMSKFYVFFNYFK